MEMEEIPGGRGEGGRRVVGGDGRDPGGRGREGGGG